MKDKNHTTANRHTNTMEADKTLKELKETICNLEQALFLATKLIGQYENILEESGNIKWCEVRKQIQEQGKQFKNEKGSTDSFA